MVGAVQAAIMLYALVELRKRDMPALLEELHAQLDELGRDIDGLSIRVESQGGERLPELISRVEETADATYRLLARPMRRELGQLGGIAGELDSRRRELEGMRKGQQGALFRRLVGEIVRIRRDLGESADDERETASIRQVYADVVELIDDHLRAIGAEQRSPKLGTDYRASELVADRPNVESASDEALDWCIASVQSEAWVIDEGEVVTVLQPAAVTIFRLAKS
ncbi:hypothetical protein N9L90_01110 [Planctomycetota bacterium]|nr:hypothetical protein [Planctomycetota bacterium]